MKKTIFYTLLAVFFIALWFYFVDLNKVIILIRKVNLIWIFLALALLFIQNYIAAVRLKILFLLYGKLPALKLMNLGYITGVASLITSLPTGGMSMVYLVKKKLAISYSKSLGVFLVSYFVDMFFTVLIAGLGVLYFIFYDKFPAASFNPFFFSMIIFISGFIALMLLILSSFKLIKISALKNTRFFHRLQEIIYSLIKAILQVLGSRKILLGTIFVTVIIEIVGYIHFWLYFQAFGVHVPLFKFILASSIFGVLNIMPGIPAKLGQQELFSLITLPFLLNLDPNIVLAVTLFNHVVGITFTFIMAWLSLRFSDTISYFRNSKKEKIK